MKKILFIVGLFLCMGHSLSSYAIMVRPQIITNAVTGERSTNLVIVAARNSEFLTYQGRRYQPPDPTALDHLQALDPWCLMRFSLLGLFLYILHDQNQTKRLRRELARLKPQQA